LANIYLLERASKAYYAGNPVMSDSEFDEMVSELRATEPSHPFLKRIGAPVSGKHKAKHIIPMGSLANANNEEEFLSWLDKLPNNPHQIHLSHKLDGLSVELIYQNGSFIQAITRGDGIWGEDITRNVIKSGDIPLSIDKNITSVRCECVILKSDWTKYFKGEANPRNSAAGTLRRKDGCNAKYLQFYAFDAIGADSCTETGVSIALRQWFRIPTWDIGTDYSFLVQWCKNQEKGRDEIPYEIDGIVAKLDCRAESQKIGSQNNRPRGQIAFKFVPRGAETTLTNVVWQVGATGAVVPIAVVAPIGVGGTIIKRASLCNIDEIERLQIAIGDTVEVVRAGDVIPKIAKLISKGDDRTEIKAPKMCPICDASVEKNGAHVFCINPTCHGKSFGRIMNWIKKRNILNLGSEIVKAIGVNSIRDLYIIITNEFYLANIQIGNGRLGESRANKIITELEKSRTVTLWEFLGCIGIKSIGRTLAKQIVVNLKIKTLKDIFALTPNDIQKLEGFAQQRAEDFCHWLSKHWSEIIELEKEMTFEKGEIAAMNNSLNGEVIVFTGKAPIPRNEMAEMAARAGATVSGSVTSKTTILVIADPNSMSSKAVKARESGVKLISPENFLEIINQ